ncbi:MAG TPA: hypothetical protein VFP70_09580 [Burkholderiales bacterium]|nr:hypothetical protein [Burkholderiales bacterium]
MQLTIEITERDFEALLAVASRLNAAVQHDIRQFHSIPGVGAAALHVGLQHMAPLFDVNLRTATEADDLIAAVEQELRRRHLKRELKAQAGEAV